MHVQQYAFYERIKAFHKFSDYEFGSPMYKGVMWHKLPDGVFAASWQGSRVFEVHPNNDMYVVINRHHTGGCTTRWADILNHLGVKNHTRFNTTTTLTAAGLKKTRVSMGQYKGSAQQVYTFGKAKLTAVSADTGVLKLEACEPAVKVVKDKAKYRAFNKELGELINILCTQIRVGAYDKYEPPRYVYNALTDLFKEHAGEENRPSSTNEIMYVLTKKWIDTKDPSLLQPVMHSILLSTFRSLYSGQHKDDATKRADYMRRVKLRKKAIQQHYLRAECARLLDSKGTLSTEDESDDQDSQLLAHDGLREVQVLSEAEIC